MSAALAGLPYTFVLSPADSARAVAQVYTVSLIATVPFVVAAVAALTLRHSSASTRALVWRSAILALLIIYLAHLLPVQWMTGVVPAALAAPLIALGELQLTATGNVAPVNQALAPAAHMWDMNATQMVRGFLLLYWLGVTVVLLPLLRGWMGTRAIARRAHEMRDAEWGARLTAARIALGVRRPLRLLVSDEVTVPMTWGVFRPVIVLPPSVARVTDTHARAMLLHELAHVRAGDVFFLLLARVVCALFWFHPAAWWVTHRLRNECELACDDRVLECGVRASDYAELLVLAADAAHDARAGREARAARPMAALLSRRAGLRQRLAAIVDVHRDSRAPTRWSLALAVVAMLTVALPMSAIRLAPSKNVLTTLMRDVRWESRAYAVMGLAQRADSVDVARAASVEDPSPRVRAWARYALTRAPGSRRLPSSLDELRISLPARR
ncbi:MAG: M56 family metallopeptidase [Gemmatimonadaceae bacterium]|nr:M56 family metallopeptidase [Gemmatimonadaceae bacterium]